MMLKTITKEIALIAACYLAFALVKNLTDPSPVFKAVSNGWSVLRLEDALAIHFESLIQQVIGRISHSAVVVTTYFYAAGMWAGLIATAIFVSAKDRSAYIDLRRTFVVSMILGAIVFAVFPLAPPRFMPGLGMTDTVTLLGLDPAPHSDSTISYNRFAAMPSLHYAWALLVMIGMFKAGGTWLKVSGVIYQALMFIAIIATANHYVLDAVAGAILLVTAIYINRSWSNHEYKFGGWKTNQVNRLRELEQAWGNRVGGIQAPDLRQQFFSGFILRGGYAERSTLSKISSAQYPLPVANVQKSFRPELNNLSLVLN